MKAIDIELALMSHFDFRRNLIVPNVTWLTRFEVDLLCVTKNGYAHGFEIKVSVSDLMRDFKKKQHNRNKIANWSDEQRLKIYFGIYKHFSYAVPFEMADKTLEVVPNHFGVYGVEEYYPPFDNALPHFRVKCLRKPKRLFLHCWSLKDRYELARLGAIRLYGLKHNIRTRVRETTT